MNARFTSALIVFAFIRTTLMACNCIPIEFVSKYEGASFIAHVRIRATFPNKPHTQFYKSAITITKIYKGHRVNSLLIVGSSDGKQRSTCDMFFPTGTELLVFANLDQNGEYVVQPCSEPRILDKSFNKVVKRELQMLNVLNEKYAYSPLNHRYALDWGNELKEFDGIKLTQSFALFEVIFSTRQKVDSIRTISGFSHDVDKRLKVILENARWIANDSDSQKSKGRKQVIAFYYYEAEKGDPSFIGSLDV